MTSPATLRMNGARPTKVVSNVLGVKAPVKDVISAVCIIVVRSILSQHY